MCKNGLNNKKIEEKEGVASRSSILYVFFDDKKNEIMFYEESPEGSLVPKYDTGIIARDPSLLRQGEKYYIAVTDVEADQRDFSIYSTSDFVNFDKHTYYVGLSTANHQAVWAPDFFVDYQEHVHLLVSVQREGNEEMIDSNGNVVRVFDTYDLLLDLETHSVSKVTLIELDGGNKIDAHVFPYDGGYLMVAKNEVTKEIELWQSQDLEKWTRLYERIPNTPRNVEGPFIVPKDGLYRIYMDSYPEGERKGEGILYVETADFNQFSEVQQLPSEVRLRHGSGISNDLKLS